MSTKRAATTELNHENWDQDDPSEPEEMDVFKTAPKEVLEKRVIRTAKRRTQATSDENKKSVFSGFSGFNKTQMTSFDFLSKLTNGSKPTNGSPKNDTVVSSSNITNNPLIASPSSGIFSMSGSTTSAFATKSPFGKSTETPSFGSNTPTTDSTVQSVFTASKADSTVNDSPFKIQPTSSSTGNTDFSVKNTGSEVSGSQVSSSIFGVSSSSINTSKSLFSTTTSSTSQFKINPVSSTIANNQKMKIDDTKNTITNKTESTENESEDHKLKYYSKLRGLNESVSAWIKKHVEETPLCILSPIFKDYEKHLKEMQDEYESKKQAKMNPEQISVSKATLPATSGVAATSTDNNKGTTLFSTTDSTKPSLFATQNPIVTEKSSSFSFGINPTSTFSTATSKGFSFGINSSPPGVTSTTSSPFALKTTTTTTITPTTTSSNGNAPFSFGIGKPFSFNTNIHKPPETVKESNEEEDEPPKVEYTPVVEENSVYDKKCKIFVKKDGNFADKGVGTLYIKKIEESGKYQLLVRANTNLGNVLLNLLLNSAIPTQRMGKNNVMLVCIPTPETKPPPTPVLIRVKTAEEADELLETLNKYKA